MSQRHRGWTLQRRYVKCGKPSCGCAAGPGHGPYWYGLRRRGARTVTRYFGRSDPRRAALRGVDGEAPGPGQRRLRQFGADLRPLQSCPRDRHARLYNESEKRMSCSEAGCRCAECNGTLTDGALR